MLIELFQNLFNKLGFIILAAFILSRSSFIKGYILKNRLSLKDKIIFSIVFGCVGIIGTYSGVEVNDAIANSRSIGVIVAGLFGGPWVGVVAGLIAGIHRMIIPIGRFTAIACGISTIIGGIIAGYSKKYIDDKPNKWIYGMILTVIIEAIQMLIILLIARPFSDALHLVKLIFLPMAFINSLGTGAFILLIQQIFEENERAAAVKAQIALSIATKTLPIFRTGLNKDSAEKAANIIEEMASFSAVSFTDKKHIIAFVGEGKDHHKTGDEICTEITKRAIKDNQYVIAKEKEDIECFNKKCKLRAAIIVPLKMKENVIGTLKLYKIAENSITSSDVELAKGLGHLFSTQIELSKITYQEELLAKTELKMLQAQIQPHFLFNALNTIIAFCRTDAIKARELLLKLSYYLRTSFKTNEDFVTLEKELEHVDSYLSIEEARFSDRLEVIYAIDSSIKCDVPPLILQPIVENALKHGLMATQEGGRIIISAKETNAYIEISVTDNGIGMDTQELSCIVNQKCESGGIGINNVNDRLKSIYNTSLKIDSAKGQGTQVIINIPKEEAIQND